MTINGIVVYTFIACVALGILLYHFSEGDAKKLSPNQGVKAVILSVFWPFAIGLVIGLLIGAVSSDR